MRERLPIYLGFALVCAGAAFLRKGTFLDLLAAMQKSGDPMLLARTPPLSVVLIAALVALFFIIPSALRHLEPRFKMTPWRALLTIVMLVSIGLVTDLGLAAALIPGIVFAVVMSQALLAALLGSSDRIQPRRLAGGVAAAFVRSLRLTRAHFATTMGIVLLSLAILGVPFLLVLCAMVFLDVIDSRTLIFTAPLLYLTFIYAECVRYTLIVRWYRRLDEDAPVLQQGAKGGG